MFELFHGPGQAGGRARPGGGPHSTTTRSAPSTSCSASSTSEGVAATALTGLGISLEGARAQVAEIVGRGADEPASHIPFTPRAKKVLELPLREASSSVTTTSAPSTSCSA